LKPSKEAVLFVNTFFQKPLSKSELIANSGSNRKYFRISIENITYILTENNNIDENKSYFYLADLFYKSNIKVPKLVSFNQEQTIYIQEDIGDESLLNFKENKGYSDEVFEMYKRSVKQLTQLQTSLKNKINYEKCYDFQQFDEKLVLNDMFYCKDFFIERLDFPFKKAALIDDFIHISKQIQELPNEYFLYRDFQSRNIFIKNESPFFIDFQGGMKGFLCYDLVSLLWQAKANLPMEWKEKLKEIYFNEIISTEKISIQSLEKSYKISLILRIFQLMGAYGLRGLVERKAHFLDSILLNINNIKYLLDENYLNDFPELKRISTYIVSKGGTKRINEIIQKK